MVTENRKTLETVPASLGLSSKSSWQQPMKESIPERQQCLTGQQNQQLVAEMLV